MTQEWWKKAVFYQIYPRSFKDSTGNGIGDLLGILSKIEYITNLGIDAVWLSPIYPSPQRDFGYDITDFRTINPEYGSMRDFDELLETFHSHEIKLIMDMVLNHTSDEHPWFKASRAQDSSKRDWYIWHPGKGSKNPPNNWRSVIGGSAWEWDTESEEFYLHQFLPFQPDLNWWNVEVRETMLGIMKFWLDKGVDGFRLDIIHTLFEDKTLRNNPFSFRLFPSDDASGYLFQNPKYTSYLPETIDFCKDLREVCNSYHKPRILIGEAMGGPLINHMLYGSDSDGLHLVFNFKLLNQPLSAKKLHNVISQAEELVPNPNWPCYALSNHDVPRMISRYGNNEMIARLLFFLLLTLRGTPFIYYGEEIGMRQNKIRKTDRKDPLADLKIWKIPIGWRYGRDDCRTPMQWNSNEINAGFSINPIIEPWLPINKNKFNHVASQYEKEDSLFSYYRSLLKLRKEYPSLQLGKLILFPRQKNIIGWKRTLSNENVLVFLNIGKNETPIRHSVRKILFSTITLHQDRVITDPLTLNKFEGIIAFD